MSLLFGKNRETWIFLSNFLMQKYIKNPYTQQIRRCFLYQYIDHYSPIHWKICSHFVFRPPNAGTIHEEVVVQRVAQLEKQVGVDPRVTENLVQVLAGVMHLVGQPSDGPALPLEFGLDEVADVESVGLWYVHSIHRYVFLSILEGTTMLF